MNKIEMAKAEVVIGGCEKVCTSTYAMANVGGEGFGCYDVQTCTDKNGETTTLTPAVDASVCSAA